MIKGRGQLRGIAEYARIPWTGDVWAMGTKGKGDCPKVRKSGKRSPVLS